MKLKSYFLLSIVVGMTFACSQTRTSRRWRFLLRMQLCLWLLLQMGKSLTKAGEGEGENIDQEDAINSLHVMVFMLMETCKLIKWLQSIEWRIWMYKAVLSKFLY